MRARTVRHDGVDPSVVGWAVGDGLGVLLLAGLALACGRADDRPEPSVPSDGGSTRADEPTSGPNESSKGDGDTSNDAGASTASSVRFECPAPRPDAMPGYASGWARDPATGNCCQYMNRSASPNGWLRFDFERDCQSRCVCSALEGFEGDYEDLPYMGDTLECRCSVESCPSSIEEAEERLCSTFPPTPAVQRLVGCGMVMLTDRNGFSGYSWVFELPNASGDAATGVPRLVGASQFSDASSSEPCDRSSWSSGRDLLEECDEAEVVTCQLCGDSPGPEYPPCE